MNGCPVVGLDGAEGRYNLTYQSGGDDCVHAVTWSAEGDPACTEEYRSHRALSGAIKNHSVLVGDLTPRHIRFYKSCIEEPLKAEDELYQPNKCFRAIEDVFNIDLMSHSHLIDFTIPFFFDPSEPMNAMAGHMLAYWVESQGKSFLIEVLGDDVRSVERMPFGHPFDSLMNESVVRQGWGEASRPGTNVCVCMCVCVGVCGVCV